MPSPIGHAMAGIAVAWSAELVSRNRALPAVAPNATFYRRSGGAFTLLCAVLGAAPDLDLIVPSSHRTVTHSLGAVVVVGMIAAVVATQTKRSSMRIGLICALAYASHLLLDWLGADYYPPRGLQVLWPINSEWYISGADLFRQTARLRIFTHGPILTNIRAIVQEIAIMGPILGALWLVRVKALARLAPQLAGGDHPAK